MFIFCVDVLIFVKFRLFLLFEHNLFNVVVLIAELNYYYYYKDYYYYIYLNGRGFNYY